MITLAAAFSSLVEQPYGMLDKQGIGNNIQEQIKRELATTEAQDLLNTAENVQGEAAPMEGQSLSYLTGDAVPDAPQDMFGPSWQPGHC